MEKKEGTVVGSVQYAEHYGMQCCISTPAAPGHTKFGFAMGLECGEFPTWMIKLVAR
jgi:hypothetical protein